MQVTTVCLDLAKNVSRAAFSDLGEITVPATSRHSP